MEAQASHFLKLPGEARNKIYRLLLVHDQPICVPGDTKHVQVQLFYLNRQVYEEAAAIFYEENVFQLAGLLQSRSRGLTLRYPQHIRKISIRPKIFNIRNDIKSTILSVLPKLTHFKELEIRYSTYYFDQEDLLDTAEQMKAWFRDGKSVIGKILTASPSVKIRMVEMQKDCTRYVRSGTRSAQCTDQGAGNKDHRNKNMGETGMSEAKTTHLARHTGDGGDDGLANDDKWTVDEPEWPSRADEWPSVRQRTVTHQAVLDPDHQRQFSVLLVPSLVEQWEYRLYDEMEAPVWSVQL